MLTKPLLITTISAGLSVATFSPHVSADPIAGTIVGGAVGGPPGTAAGAILGTAIGTDIAKLARERKPTTCRTQSCWQLRKIT